MTNWPNIQEYKNFEVKFIDDSKSNVLNDSAANNELETVIKDCYEDKNADDFLNSQKFQNPESKIVRCVIRKDFEETFKKLDREDGVAVNREIVRPKPQESVLDRSLDKVRLQNHLKWKKQKEEEYLQKKEAEKLALQKKREEELRLEKVKKQREKEREEKIREWQEQKTREKDEKKKENMVIKKLEEELKVTPSVDKKKLIAEWVKLKNKQKQIEAQKKAELLKKEEENKALRQNLAELSYKRWKERIKGRMMTLPKNGYQIFGPKPAPVVKEDWNHDFISGSPRNQDYSLRNTKSNTTTALTLCPTVKELEDLSKDIFELGEIKSRSPSLCQLKKIKSGLNLYDNSEAFYKPQYEMPLKELQPGTIDLKKKESKTLKSGFEKRKTDSLSHNLNSKSNLNFFSHQSGKEKRPDDYLSEYLCLSAVQGDQNQCIISSESKRPLDLLNALPGAQLLPNKKRVDLYLNTYLDNGEEEYQETVQKKQPVKGNDAKIPEGGKTETIEKKVSNKTPKKNTSKTKCNPKSRTRSLSLQKFEQNANETVKAPVKKPTEPERAKVKVCRRSQSYEKSVKKVTKSEQKLKSCSSTKSMIKVTGSVDETRKSLRLAKSKTCCSQKGRSRKLNSETVAKKNEKKPLELEYKAKKKLKRKNSLSKSLSFSDSPYSAKNSSKSLHKLKAGCKKNSTDAETKSDEGGHCRKLLTTKI